MSESQTIEWPTHHGKYIEVVCHRGAPNHAPENTFAAARLALAQGANYVELDVNMSADGVHYVFHGPRLDHTTDGAGLFHMQDAATLDTLDAGSWFGQDFAGEPIPRLDAMLAFLRGKCKVFFDVKRANLPILLDMVSDAGLQGDCFFWFGREADARAFRALTPGLPLKVNVTTAADVRRAKAELNASIVEVKPRHLSRGIVEICRELDMRLMVNYMGKDEAVFAELARWPLDLINLNHMDLWQATLQKAGQKAAHPASTAIPEAGPPTRRVVLFLLDGCRPDAIQQADTPAIDSLLAKGSHTWTAQTVMPSISLPCHTSLFYSLDPSIHGVQENIWQRPPSPAQSIAEVLAAAGHDVAMFYTWEQLRDLSAPGTVRMAIQHRLSQAGLDAVGEAAAHHIAAQKPAFSFVYLEATDAYGHQFGWMSPEYLEAVSYSDRLIGKIIEQLEAGGDAGETVFVVMADHGGHAFGHGTNSAEDLTIPLIIAGPGVRQGYPISGAVRIIDIAPTLLRLMDVAVPDHWRGQSIDELSSDRHDAANRMQ